MARFKVSVSKKQKRYSIILNAETETEARKKVHAEGYSILNVAEYENKVIKKHKFYFEAVTKDGTYKKGRVVASDPFKVYVKLKDGLDYDVKFLYSENERENSEGEKLDTMSHLKEQYELYKSHVLKDKSTKTSKDVTKKAKRNLENFYIKKELDETYRLIDFVLIKLKNILEKSGEEEVDTERKEKLKSLYNAIVKVKKTTNINKLKEIGELALKKVGEIELEILEKYKDGNSKKLLKETNTLLKKMGSKEHFVEKDKDFGLIVKKLFNEFGDNLKSLKPIKKQKKQELDKEGSSYWRTELLVSKYREKKVSNMMKMLKKFYIFLYPFGTNREEIDNLLIRRKIIKQNITILQAKITGKLVSYTKVVKGYSSIIKYLLLILKHINTYIFFIIYFFSLIFLFYLFGIKYEIIEFSINMRGIFSLIYIIIMSILIFLTRGVITLTINLALFLFLFILGVVNF